MRSYLRVQAPWSYILFWLQFVSVCFAMKLFFSFKIHCLQMLHLFQTWDGPIFFIVTLVYTCHAFFAVPSESIYPIYCFGHSLSQSVSQENSFSPFKYIIYKCFRPGMGHFFSSSHFSTLVMLFFRKYLSHIFWSQLGSVCFTMKFFFSFTNKLERVFMKNYAPNICLPLKTTCKLWQIFVQSLLRHLHVGKGR